MRNRPWIALALLAILIGLIPAPTTRAADQVVISTNDSGPGSLRQALIDVTPGGTITFDLAPYPKTITLSSALSVNQNLTIQGPGEDNLTIDGNDLGRVFYIDLARQVSISDLSISNGKVTGSPAYGGCIHNRGTLTLDDVIVIGCEATGVPGGHALGGAIHSEGVLHVNSSSILLNLAEGGNGNGGPAGDAVGGGIFVDLGTQATIKDSGFLGNTARGGSSNSQGASGKGGALAVSLSATASVTDTAFLYNGSEGGNGNDAGGGGYGGAVDSYGDFSALGCWFAGNQAKGSTDNGDASAHGGDAYGGALYNREHMDLEHCLLEANTVLGADGSGTGNGGLGVGGGLACEGDTKLTVEGSTFKDNVAQSGASGSGGGSDGWSQGGALATSIVPGDASSVTLINSTFGGNKALSDRSGFGGAIYTGLNPTVEISFCTIAYNEADNGGGIYTDGTVSGEGPVLISTIVAKNQAPWGPDLTNYFNSRGWNLIGDHTTGHYTLDITTPPNTNTGNRLGIDPKLGPLQYNGGPSIALGMTPHTIALLLGSPAINNGSDADIDGNQVTADQRAFPRPDAWSNPPRKDIGAYERGAADLVMTKVAVPDQVVPGDTITFYLTCANTGSEWASGVLITDTIPPELTQATVITSSLPITDTGASPPFVWQMADIPPQQSGYITLTAVVKDGLPAMSQFTNTAAATTTELETDLADNQHSTILTVLNAPPVARDDSYRIGKGRTLKVAAPGVLGNDTDANGDALAAAKDLDPARGTLTLNTDGSFTYTPADDLEGTVTFLYTASDGTDQSNSATVTITLTKHRAHLPIVQKK